MERARPARWSDAGRLVALCRDALSEIRSERGGGQLAGDLLAGRSVDDLVDEALGSPDAHVVAGEYDGVVLAVGVVRGVAGAAARIEALYVHPGARAVGVGEAVLDALSAWAAARGCTGLDAVALPGDRPAKAFFEAHGMVARALVMHRPIPPVAQ
ncbi:MAG TPA: GNAT family N-acetyltransferase [Acidimicrobiales bacterium]|nr:GNAT family N-acetyltransferase [Acidimicrobiales bacterium]